MATFSFPDPDRRRLLMSEGEVPEVNQAYAKSEPDGTMKGESPKHNTDASSHTTIDYAFQSGIFLDDTSSSAQQEFKDQILKSLAGLLQKYGSVSKFLSSRFGSQSEAQLFVQHLHEVCRAGHPVHHVQHEKLPALQAEGSGSLTKSEVLQLPLAAFSFGPHCSVKSEPDHSSFLDLAESILTEGFISKTEPVVCMQSGEVIQDAAEVGTTAPWTGSLIPFSVGFTKGRSRVHALLAILSLTMDNKIDLQQARDFTFWPSNHSSRLQPFLLVVES